jgi:hypothetical protein
MCMSSHHIANCAHTHRLVAVVRITLPTARIHTGWLQFQRRVLVLCLRVRAVPFRCGAGAVGGRRCAQGLPVRLHQERHCERNQSTAVSNERSTSFMMWPLTYVDVALIAMLIKTFLADATMLLCDMFITLSVWTDAAAAAAHANACMSRGLRCRCAGVDLHQLPGGRDVCAVQRLLQGQRPHRPRGVLLPCTGGRLLRLRRQGQRSSRLCCCWCQHSRLLRCCCCTALRTLVVFVTCTSASVAHGKCLRCMHVSALVCGSCASIHVLSQHNNYILCTWWHYFEMMVRLP